MNILLLLTEDKPFTGFLCNLNNDKTLKSVDKTNRLGVNKVIHRVKKLFDCIGP